MKRFAVEIPIAGYVRIEVEAENEEDAIEKAFDIGYKNEDIQEMEMFEKLVEGNVCHTYHTRASAEEIED